MKPAVRWLIVGLVVVLLAILLWLWNPFGQEEASPDGDTVEQTAAPTPPAPRAAPVAPKVAEPVTAVVLFGFDQSVLRAEATAKLDELGARFKDGAFDRVEAFGHADRIGSDAYNMKLSRQRAETVRGYLLDKAVASDKIRTDARGESESVTGAGCRNMGTENRKNRNLIECLQPDRRVQITLVPTR